MLENIKEKLKEADSLYVFLQVMAARENCPRDYGTDELYTLVEVHTLAEICKHEGITGSELAKLFLKTKGAITQIVSKLEEKGLVRKERDEENRKCVRLYPTAKGKKLQEYHTLYDVMEMTRIHEHLEQTCTEEEIGAFFKVMKFWEELYRSEIR